MKLCAPLLSPPLNANRMRNIFIIHIKSAVLTVIPENCRDSCRVDTLSGKVPNAVEMSAPRARNKRLQSGPGC